MKTWKHFFSILLAFLFITGISLRSSAQEQQKKEEEKKNTEHFEYNMGGMKVQKTGEDTLLVTFKKHDHHMSMDKPCGFMCRKGKYNGHWAGVELGWNGYVNEDFNMDFPSSQAYMNINVARSLMVNLNPFELNLNLVKNHFGFTSGLGFQMSNYYFTDNQRLIPDSATLTAYRLYDMNGDQVKLKVNKLYIVWLNVPLLFECQTNSGIKSNSFHFTLGVIGGLRIASYTKQTFETWNTFYTMKDENGKSVGTFYAGKSYIRSRGAYHLNNFKLDATARIGWSFLNFFATYSLTQMYRDDKAPEVYPWTIGITLVGW